MMMHSLLTFLALAALTTAQTVDMSLPTSNTGRCGNLQREGRSMRCPQVREERTNQQWLPNPNKDAACCSEGGYCGFTRAHCMAGCQEKFGFCLPENTPEDEEAVPDTCGPLYGNKTCAGDKCCSSHGFCGTSKDHCKSPDCLMEFGRCDASIVPKGDNTTSIDRSMGNNKITMNGNDVGYGVNIYHCNNAGDIALTYDDGPYNWTSQMIELLDQASIKATFFVTGVNNGKGAIDDASTPWPAALKQAYKSGHQIASHTWSHADLDALNEHDRRDEMIKLEMALRNVLGVIPTYMRPPFSSCGEKSGCLQTMRDLGYYVVLFDLDTQDYSNGHPARIQLSKDVFKKNIDDAKKGEDGHLVIAHDTSYQSAVNLTSYMISEIKKKGLRGVTVAECLGGGGVGEGGWYRDARQKTDDPEEMRDGEEDGEGKASGVVIGWGVAAIAVVAAWAALGY